MILTHVKVISLYNSEQIDSMGFWIWAEFKNWENNWYQLHRVILFL